MATVVVDGFVVDTESGAFHWLRSRLMTEQSNVQKHIVRDMSETDTAKLRGRSHLVQDLLKDMDKLSNP
jgi:hypothetical protein